MVTSTPTPGGLQLRARWAAEFVAILCCFGVANAAEYDSSCQRLPPPAGIATTTEWPPTSDLTARLERLERENAEFAQQQLNLLNKLETLSWQHEGLKQKSRSSGVYDRERGAFVLVRGGEDRPFELRADFFTEARYTNFSRNAESFVDSTGTVRPINNLESIEINRNFIQFSGFVLDPKLQFTAFVFSSTALNDTLYLGWINYRFSEAVDLRVGTWLLPGTREWYESFRYTQGAERLMATTFFRPNVTPGVWAQGVLCENLHYVAMWGNSSNRLSQGIERRGAPRTFSGTVWWESTGDFGPGPSDIECHTTPSVRLGTSFTSSKELNQGFSSVVSANPEDTILRLSDGTPLFRDGALAPGVQLLSTQYNLWAIDAGIKYRGMSLSGEYFFRLLNDFKSAPAQVPLESLFDHGGLLQGGIFVIPGLVEIYGRTSYVTGEFGSGHEYGAGVNWHPQSSREWRFTAEVLQIQDSPAENLLTGYRAGQNGTLYQLQWFVDF